MAGFMDRFRSAVNIFTQPERVDVNPLDVAGQSIIFADSPSNSRPDRSRLRISNDKSIVPSIYTRISIDVSSIEMRHTKHDDQDRYVEDMVSGLNNCLRVEANVDQAANSFIQDIVLKCFDKGVAAIVPVDTTLDPRVSGAYDIRSMRVGTISKWYPDRVQVNLYNDKKGQMQLITLPKSMVGIVENPFYQVMNEPNSTLQRLQRKLTMLDAASSSGKLDLIIQLPYVIKSEARRQAAEQRAKDIEFQLKSNKYGIAYTDGTEKITQLNRPTENSLMGQIEYLTNLLFSQLGLTPEIMNGTAAASVMLNYQNRTIKPILDAIAQEMRRKFLTKTARSQGQSVDYFANPFSLIPMSELADIVDKLSRNEVLTGNEFRGFLGMRPSADPKADSLANPNMPTKDTGVQIPSAVDDSEPIDSELEHVTLTRQRTIPELRRLGSSNNSS
jgi:hypothetical protein